MASPPLAQSAAPMAAIPLPVSPPARPPARRARLRRRHVGVILSFLSLVVLPLVTAAWYLWARAADQYMSTMGFSVRHEEAGTALEFLGSSLAGLSGSSSSDTDILYEFIQSQKLVADMDAALDLKTLWGRPEDDPVFAFDASGSIEDLISYWNRMVQVYYDRSAGLIEVRVRAFDPEEAQQIAEVLRDKSAEMINELSAIARADAIRFSRQELTEMKERLTLARQAVLDFRNAHQLVDPVTEVLSQTELISELQAELAATLIELDLLEDTAHSGDARIEAAKRRARVITSRITAERQKLGVRPSSAQDTALKEDQGAFAELISDYERLVVEREFAEKTYISALATYDASLAEARRKSRYLAAYMQPTLAETSRFPQRGLILVLLGFGLFLSWAILALISYAIKDRR